MFDELAGVAFSDLPPLRESPEPHSLGLVEEAIKLYEGRMPEADLMRLLSTF